MSGSSLMFGKEELSGLHDRNTSQNTGVYYRYPLPNKHNPTGMKKSTLIILSKKKSFTLFFKYCLHFQNSIFFYHDLSSMTKVVLLENQKSSICNSPYSAEISKTFNITFYFFLYVILYQLPSLHPEQCPRYSVLVAPENQCLQPLLALHLLHLDYWEWQKLYMKFI